MTESTDTTRKIETLRSWSKCLPDIANEMERVYNRAIDLHRKLVEAEYLIRALDAHEGAEGWSQYLRERLDKYEFAILSTQPEGKTK